jgi:hypothetical protein
MKLSFLSLLSSLFLVSTVALAGPAQIIIIRHAEKPATGNDLCPAGVQHAQELVSYFQTDKKVTQYGTPVAIYAMAPSDSDESQRPIETVTPLAKALGLTINKQFAQTDFEPLKAAIMNNSAYDGKMVLICWEHKVIPDLAAALGVSPEPSKWHGSDFTTVYRINFDSNKNVTDFKTFSENIAQPTAPCN